jgi:competence protein ComEA
LPRFLINTADAETLAQLPGIGALKAQAIVEDRTANGPFTSVDELDRVSGIGTGTIEGLRAQAEI